MMCEKNWREHWKQENPFDQHVVILMSMEGHMYNFRNGIACDKALDAIEGHIVELKALEPYLRQGRW
jgi:hypothetical protein